MRRFWFFFILPLITQAQDQTVADSLIHVLNTTTVSDSSRLALLTFIAQNENDMDRRIAFTEELEKEARSLENDLYLHHALIQRGQAYRIKGDFELAIGFLFEALQYAEKVSYLRGIAGTNTALGDIYSILGMYDTSIPYYKKSIEQVVDYDSSMLAVTLLNLGDTYYVLEQYDSALQCFQSSRAIYEKLGNDPSGLAYNLGNIGLVFAELGLSKEAEENIDKAIVELEALGDHYGSAVFLGYMAEIYGRKGINEEALSYADSSLAISERFGLKTENRDNLYRIYTIYESQGKYDKALEYYKEYVMMKDSISSEEVYSRIENLETRMELERKETEVELLQAQKKNQQAVVVISTVIVFAFAILVIVIFIYYRSKIRVNRMLTRQKASLERLNETKDKFFSIISHDLRGPISSLMGVSHLIRHFVEDKSEEELLKMADHMELTVEQLTVLLDNLLNWAMQQQGHFPNVPEKVDFNDMLEEIVGMFSNMAAGKKIAVSSNLDADMQLWVDRNSVHTIFRNLINNAIKFTQEGGEIAVNVKRNGEVAEVTVSDTGIGMTKEKMKKIFNLSGERATYGTAGEKGLGLGLQLVHEFVSMNGGSIEVDSKEGEGTTFLVKLPLFDSVSVKEEATNS